MSALVPAAVIAAAAALAVAAVRRRRAGSQQPTASVQPPIVSVPPPPGLAPEVWQRFPAWVGQFEGIKIPTMYLDILGLVTVGTGNLIDYNGAILPAALLWPWLRPDGSRATPDEIRAEWARVKAQPKALVWTRYRDPQRELHLPDDAMDNIIRAHLAADVAALSRSLPDFPSYPAPAQQALLGIAWGVGSTGLFTKMSPAFVAAVRARDWRTAAETCAIPGGTARRTAAHRDLFLAAA